MNPTQSEGGFEPPCGVRRGRGGGWSAKRWGSRYEGVVWLMWVRGVHVDKSLFDGTPRVAPHLRYVAARKHRRARQLSLLIAQGTTHHNPLRY